MDFLRWLLRHLLTPPRSPEGRKMRIEKLMRDTGEERDVCAAVIYYRDVNRGFLSREELADLERLVKRLDKGEITMPVDRG